MTMMNATDREKAFEALCEQALKLGYLVSDWVSVEQIQHSHDLTEEQAFAVLPHINIWKIYEDSSDPMPGLWNAVDIAIESAGVDS